MPLTSEADIRALLTEARHIAVVGYSDDPGRPSNGVTWAILSFGYQVSAVNPTSKGHDRLKVYASLAAVPEPIDIVDVFRRPEYLLDVVEQAIAVHAKAVWMQLGIINHEAARRAEAAGLKVVMDRCLKVDYLRLIH